MKINSGPQRRSAVAGLKFCLDMKKLFLSVVCVLLAATLLAQTYQAEGAREAIAACRLLAAGNYLAYDNLYAKQDHPMTPAPEGYVPFYVSTYARHGSRWLTSARQYDVPIEALTQAEKESNLTEEGMRVLADLRAMRVLSPDEKLGVLTSVGFEQHNGIAARMCERFPEVFDKKAMIEASASRSPRCVKSMAEECEAIHRICGAWATQESGSKEMQIRMAGETPSAIKEAEKGKDALYAAFKKAHTHPERLMAVLLKDPDKMKRSTQNDVMRKLFEVAGNMQSHPYSMDFLRLFTDEECYDLWMIHNVSWYLNHSFAPETGGICPWRMKRTLQDIVEKADSAVNNPKRHGATLRFGHDGCLLDLASLLGLGTLAQPVADIDTLDRVFRNYELIPMAANIQLIFYRPVSGDGDILVKALLCEREIALPAEPVQGPYCRWEDVRAAWMEKLQRVRF